MAIRKHVASPPPAPGQRDDDLISKPISWLCDNAKKGIRRDEGGQDLLARMVQEMQIAGFASMTENEQADWVLGRQLETVRGIHARVDPYVDEIKMRAVGRK